MSQQRQGRQTSREVDVDRNKSGWFWLAVVVAGIVVLGLFLGSLVTGSWDDPVANGSSDMSVTRTTASQSATPAATSSATPTATTATTTATLSSTVPPTQAPTTTVAPAPATTTTQAPPPVPARTTIGSYTYCNYNASNGIVVMVSPTQSATLVMAPGVSVPNPSSARSNYTFEVDPANPAVVYGFSAQTVSEVWTCDQYTYGGDWILPPP